MKYPIGIQDFKKIINGGYVYVDKTALIYDLVSEGSVYFLSRPRRFGKSLLVSTLKYYFEGEKELFKGLAIDKLEKDWKKYPVFQLSFGGQNYSNSDELPKYISECLDGFEKQFGITSSGETLGTRFKNLLLSVYNQTGLGCVVLIDEYDKPLLDVIGLPDKVKVNNTEKSLEEYNRDILKGFYSVLKDSDPSLQFVLLTGVTKFSQVSVFSGFNQPDDISLVPRYDSLCGITTEELYTVFADSIREMDAEYNVSEDEMKQILKRRYDGYHFSKSMNDIYNPFSLLGALKYNMLGSYWFRSGTPEYLIRLLNHSKENINDLVGKKYVESQFIDYKANVEKPLPMIYQSGYLTIKGYNAEDRSYILDFPNEEVVEGFVTLLASEYLKTDEEPVTWVLRAKDALKQADLEEFRNLLTSYLASVPYSVRHKDDEKDQERFFQLVVFLLMKMIGCYTVYHEKYTSRGRVDCVVETKDYVYVIEYKLDHPASEALAQIEEKAYALEYSADSRKLFKIGCTFSSETGTISDWLVKE